MGGTPTPDSVRSMAEASQDNVLWFQKPLLNISGGSASGTYWTVPVYALQYTLAASTTADGIVIDIPMCHGWFRCRVWGTGTPTTTDAVTITLGGGAI